MLLWQSCFVTTLRINCRGTQKYSYVQISSSDNLQLFELMMYLHIANTILFSEGLLKLCQMQLIIVKSITAGYFGIDKGR